MALRNRQRRLRTVLGGAAASVALALTSVLASATPASAHSTIGQCNGSFWGMLSQSACVVMTRGGKNYANHTELATAVEVNHKARPHRLEIWGDGFYHVGYGNRMVIPVNKWLRSGTHVCGAVTDDHGVRSIACIGIKV